MRNGMKRLLVLLLGGLFLAGCGGNLYMKRGTNEYNRVTANLVGDWKVSSYTVKGAEKIGSPYKLARATFEDIEEGKAYGNAQFVFTLKDDVVRERAKQWGQRYPDVKVDRYNVMVNARWQLRPTGDVLILHDPLVSADITGKGKNMQAVIGWENGKLLTASALSDGSREGQILGNIMKSTTELTPIYPEMPAQSRFQLSPAQLKTNSVQRISFTLAR